MYYIDTDVLVHSLVNQNPILYEKINDLIEQLNDFDDFAISWLSIVETGFVLGKLNQSSTFTADKLDYLMAANPIQYGLAEFNRAIELARIIGFRNFNDCLHVAIAEKHCTHLYTCNIKDFKRLEPYTELKILIVK